MFEYGLLIGLLISLFTLILSALLEFIKLACFFKKHNYKLKVFNFLFHYYEVIYDLIRLKILDDNAKNAFVNRGIK